MSLEVIITKESSPFLSFQDFDMITMLRLFPIAVSADQPSLSRASCSDYFPTILILLTYLGSLSMSEAEVCLLSAVSVMSISISIFSQAVLI